MLQARGLLGYLVVVGEALRVHALEVEGAGGELGVCECFGHVGGCVRP